MRPLRAPNGVCWTPRKPNSRATCTHRRRPFCSPPSNRHFIESSGHVTVRANQDGLVLPLRLHSFLGGKKKKTWPPFCRSRDCESQLGRKEKKTWPPFCRCGNGTNRSHIMGTCWKTLLRFSIPTWRFRKSANQATTNKNTFHPLLMNFDVTEKSEGRPNS